jgi:hypothetical protein
MHYSYYTLIALDLARERAAEADRHRLAALAHPGRGEVGVLRRTVARVAVAVARAADERLVRGELAFD